MSRFLLFVISLLLFAGMWALLGLPIVPSIGAFVLGFVAAQVAYAL